MLTADLWNEVKSRWPSGYAHVRHSHWYVYLLSYWDEFMRRPDVRKGRHCLRPEISRWDMSPPCWCLQLDRLHFREALYKWELNKVYSSVWWIFRRLFLNQPVRFLSRGMLCLGDGAPNKLCYTIPLPILDRTRLVRKDNRKGSTSQHISHE